MEDKFAYFDWLLSCARGTYRLEPSSIEQPAADFLATRLRASRCYQVPSYLLQPTLSPLVAPRLSTLCGDWGDRTNLNRHPSVCSFPMKGDCVPVPSPSIVLPTIILYAFRFPCVYNGYARHFGHGPRGPD